ncbi:ATP-NAD kinase family protein [Arthrobacter sp. H14-L1]|uniref:ATP-NAD kinase family protein n=1 Tax=Arthrobacter sp. H14-L1 TaxID=2996697 RepID=UPI00226FD2A1|nr:NAD(+)/NADH kinase [Arthrobacter sp. H14-L1]MCY0903324.1 NAD(+)/NADH kinase [Arthrobacter sp. H14-L1]
MDVLRVGLIVNPVAGLGGPAGQKGSDAADIRVTARTAGYAMTSPVRAKRTIQQLVSLLGQAGRELRLYTGPGTLGGDIGKGLCPTTLLWPRTAGTDETSAADTRRLAMLLKTERVDLILFAGGDGTARDVLDTVGGSIPVLGIPTGVKIYSAVFALTPTAAGTLAANWLLGRSDKGAERMVAEREVVDMDEVLLRAGLASPALYGALNVPVDPSRLQARKAPTPASDANAVASLARAFVRGMEPDHAYVLGPGGTTAAIGRELGLATTRLGVDVVRDGTLLSSDVDAHALEAALRGGPEGLLDRLKATIVLTPLGGQGFVVGRGNQQITPRLLSSLPLQIVATDAKLAALAGRPLWVDSGDDDVDARLSGYAKVFTGASTHTVYPVSRVSEESQGTTTTKEY